MKEWPDYFPDGVPPPDSVETDGTAFRLVENFPPVRLDFQSNYEEKPKDYGAKLWMACGASMFTDIEGAIKARNRFPRLRKKMIAVGEMVSDLGKMKNTPSVNSHKSHITVWFRLNSEPEKYINNDAE